MMKMIEPTREEMIEGIALAVGREICLSHYPENSGGFVVTYGVPSRGW